MAPFTIGQATDLVDLSIQKIFLKSSNPEEQYKKYFNFRTTEDYYEKDSGLSGLGRASFVDENAVITSDTPIQTFDKSYTQEMIGTILPFSHRMWKFGIKKRDLENVVQELRNADLREREQLCAERLTNGFDSTSYTHYTTAGSKSITTSGGDSVGAFDNSHTREDSGTDMNNVVYDGTTYNPVFDYSGVKSAYRTAAQFVDPRGNPMPASLDTLVCKKGSSVHFKAMEILGAIKKGWIPESTDHDASAVGAFTIIPLDYLTADAKWFMFDSSKKSDRQGFQFIESESITLEKPNIVYKTLEIQVAEHSMFQLGHNDVARMWVGSEGDSSTPS